MKKNSLSPHQPSYAGAIDWVAPAEESDGAELPTAGLLAADTLDALPVSICVLDETGTIIAVNRTWREFAPDSAPEAVAGVGMNYLAVCDAATGSDAVTAQLTAAGIRSVLGQKTSIYYGEYPCHVPGQRRWFAVRVSKFRRGPAVRLVVAHSDITSRWQAQVELEKSQTHLRELTNRLLVAREEESGRIARVVHDELGQQLTGLKMDLRAIEKLLLQADEASVKRARRRAQEASDLIDATVTTVQRIAAELRPAILDQLGLWAALRTEISAFGKRAQLDCQLSLPVEEPAVTEATATACFRIVQEALTNVARHAEATQVELRLTITETNHLVVLIEDNGIGIDLSARRQGHSLGLLGMQERARQLGGSLIVSRRPAGGTSVRAEFPSAQAVSSKKIR